MGFTGFLIVFWGKSLIRACVEHVQTWLYLPCPSDILSLHPVFFSFVICLERVKLKGFCWLIFSSIFVFVCPHCSGINEYCGKAVIVRRFVRLRSCFRVLWQVFSAVGSVVDTKVLMEKPAVSAWSVFLASALHQWTRLFTRHRRAHLGCRTCWIYREITHFMRSHALPLWLFLCDFPCTSVAHRAGNGEGVKLIRYHRNLQRADLHLLHFWKVYFTLLVSEIPHPTFEKVPLHFQGELRVIYLRSWL